MNKNNEAKKWNHVPVMLDLCAELLSPAIEKSDAILVDATLGLAGHSEAFLSKFPALRVVGIDRDLTAISIAKEKLEKFADRFTFVHAKYDEIFEIAKSKNFVPTAFLFDLGVSSMQLDDESRGFAYSKDASLDMRMNQNSETEQTADELITNSSVEELAQIIKEFGEERHATSIAKKIKASLPKTTGELATAVRFSLPKSTKEEAVLSSIKRVFQAIRIAVNDELSILQSALNQAIDLLPVGGRIVVMSYQSLEDRIVKQTFSKCANPENVADKLGLPFSPKNMAKPTLKFVVKGAVLADDDEVKRNSRSKPVRLRAVEKIALKEVA